MEAFFSHSTNRKCVECKGEKMYFNFLQTFTKDLNPSHALPDVGQLFSLSLLSLSLSLSVSWLDAQPSLSPAHTVYVFVSVRWFPSVSVLFWLQHQITYLQLLLHTITLDKDTLSRQESIKDANHFYLFLWQCYFYVKWAIWAKLSNFLGPHLQNISCF